MTRKPRIALFFQTELGYWLEVLQGITQFSSLYGPWEFLLANFGDVSIDRLGPDMAIDGICFHEAVGQNLSEPIIASGIPAVNLDGEPRGTMPSVGPDDAAIGRAAAVHLLERRFHHFAFCGFDHRTFSERRRAGFTAALRENGRSCHVFHGDSSANTWGAFGNNPAQKQIGAWIQSLPKPVGIMACTDLRARHVVLSCAACSIHVPEDVAIVGVDNVSSICESTSPPISSIPLDGRRTGFEAASMLTKLMSAQALPTHLLHVPPASVAVRRSTDIFAIEDREVAAAARFVADHAHEPISVDTICEAVVISRRALEQRFRRIFNRGLYEEILRVRLARAKRLLAETDLSMSEVAQAIGLPSGQALSEFFRRMADATPSAYRKSTRPKAQP